MRKIKQNELTETDKFRPVPVTKLIVHHIAPISGPLILCRPSSLKAKPCSFRTFHIASSNTRFVVKREIGLTVFLVGGQMKFRNNAGNDLVIQALCVFEWEASQAVSKIDAPLTYNIIRCNLFRLKVVRRAPNHYVVSIGIPV